MIGPAFLCGIICIGRRDGEICAVDTIKERMLLAIPLKHFMGTKVGKC